MPDSEPLLTDANVATTWAGESARAPGLDDCGMVVMGQRTGLADRDVTHPAVLAYRIGFNSLHIRTFGGSS